MAKKLEGVVRDEIGEFALIMEEKFSQHDDKGWSVDACEIGYLWKRLREEIAELRDAMLDEHAYYEVVRECADAANFALLLARNYRRHVLCSDDRDTLKSWPSRKED